MPNGTLSVTILGAGHGGFALAGSLALAGHAVTLWNRSFQRIAAVAESGTLSLTLPGLPPTTAHLAGVTADLGAAVGSSSRLLVALPASAHAELARSCAPYLRDGQSILLMPGRTGGALEFRRLLQEAGCRARILLGEANTFPFAARCIGPAEARIFGTKSEVLAAALPANRTADLLAAWQPLLTLLAPAESVLHTGLSNLGAILHPIITLLNADRIRAAQSFDFYTEGVTPTVAAALAIADEERLAIAQAYGVPSVSLCDWIAQSYGHRPGRQHSEDSVGSLVRAAVGGNPSYAGIKAPTTLVHRYLLEDVPTGMIPLIALGEAAGLGTPALRTFVSLARATLGPDRWQNERTLEQLGLAGLRKDEISELVDRQPSRLWTERAVSLGSECLDLVRSVTA